jgi:hypothetical protein
MARVKGGLFTGMLDVNKRFPLDSRMLVTKREDLINPTVWKTNTLNTEATYNVMIVSVNSDGEHNGVYYLIDRKLITAENYSAYKVALAAGEDVDPYFSMWMKLGTLGDLAAVEKKLKELIDNVKPSINLTPVDGTIVIAETQSGDKSIGVAIAPIAGNMLAAVDGGLFVPETSIRISDNAHGLVAVDGVLTLNLATKDSDGAMSKEDKIALDELKNSVSLLNDALAWGEM